MEECPVFLTKDGLGHATKREDKTKQQALLRKRECVCIPTIKKKKKRMLIIGVFKTFRRSAF